MAHIIAVTNQKGGVGKTTTTINLGAALAEIGRYTLIADLDPQGGLSLGLGLTPDDLDLTLYNVLTDSRIVIGGLVHHLRSHLDLLPSNIDLAVAELQLVSAMGREFRLRDALAEVRDKYDYILLDCPPSLGLLTVNALCAADAVLVPVQSEYFALRGVESLMDVVARIRRRLNPRLEILGLVPTMVNMHRNHHQTVINQLREKYPDKVMDVIIKESIKLADAPALHRPILETDSRHEGALAYRQLARAVLKYWNDIPVGSEIDQGSITFVGLAPEPATPAKTNGNGHKAEPAVIVEPAINPVIAFAQSAQALDATSSDPQENNHE